MVRNALRLHEQPKLTFRPRTFRMDALKILIGKIPSNPLWAEMLAARQRHNRQRAASGATKTSAEGGEGQESGE